MSTTARRLAFGAPLLSTGIAVGSIVSAWFRLSATIDEANHIATGLEWLQHGTYTMWTENPPLPRVAVALGPYLAGARLPPPEAYAPARSPEVVSWGLGSELVYRDGAYSRNLAQARAGTLPFFLVVVLTAASLAARAGGWLAGAIAAVLMATLPPLLGNASVATTDVAFVAAFLLAAWAFARWLEEPTGARSAALGSAAALAVLTKFTALVFFPIAAAALWLGHRGSGPSTGSELRRRTAGLVLAAVVATLVVWAGFRFSFGRVDAPQFRTRALQSEILKPAAERRGLQAVFTAMPLPAPALFHGLLHLKAHNAAGHPAYLLGEQRQHGFRLFYPVALFFKAPLPFLAILAVGLVSLIWRFRAPEARAGLALAGAAVGILLALVPSRMNLGVRHALVVYALAGTAAAVGAARWIVAQQGRRRATAAAIIIGLLVAQQAVVLRSHPDHLAFFNTLAGSDPGRLLEGGDLDWGQGLFELRREAHARGVDRLHIAMWMGITRLCEHGLPPLVGLPPHEPATGWVAINQAMYSGRLEHRSLRDPCDPRSVHGKLPGVPPGWYHWLHRHEPVWRGSGLRLYHIEGKAQAR